MGTPFITHIEPTNLDAYDRRVSPLSQPPGVPKGFRDAMIVREAVFVKEQGVPLDGEFDGDDPRSCHWIVYASVSTPGSATQASSKTDTGHITKAEATEVAPRPSAVSMPIGTLRLVPFPHSPHPVSGGKYVTVDGDMVLESVNGKNGSTDAEPTPSSGADRDRATTFHDGQEPYVKLGRLAVLREYRGHRLGSLLVTTALEWMRNHPTYFDQSVTAVGLDGKSSDVPRFRGLVCAHAQESAVGTWKKLGFQVDDGMGKWWEEGIAHVGMFLRLEIEPQPMPYS